LLLLFLVIPMFLPAIPRSLSKIRDINLLRTCPRRVHGDTDVPCFMSSPSKVFVQGSSVYSM
jgi:hypothetical protein